MSLKVRCLLALSFVGSLPIGQARAEETPTKDQASAECVSAYEQAQEQRQSGKLLGARVHLQSCARDACPGFIRSDCAAWYHEVQAEVPSVVFAARSAGRDLTDVRVSSAQGVHSLRTDGEAVELDPGEYDFQFAAPGMKPVTQHVLISRGERNRLQRVELVPWPKAGPAADGALLLPARAQPGWVLPVVFGGVAVVGLSSFGVFGAWGRSEESRLESTCSPHCRDDQISSVKTKYAVADVSLAVGIASLGLATFFALSSGPERRAAQASSFDLQASPRALNATYRGAF